MISLSRRSKFHVTMYRYLVAAGFALGTTPSVVTGPGNAVPKGTLTADASRAELILFGQLANPNNQNGTVDLMIEVVVKPHEDFPAGTKKLTLKRVLPANMNNNLLVNTKFLFFCDVYPGGIDPYQGEPVPLDSPIAEYVKGALAIQDKDEATRLKYFFYFLDNKDETVSSDAYREFVYAGYPEFRKVAERASAEKILARLRDPKTPALRLGLYGSILGHCGKPEHAKVLRELLEISQHQMASGSEGIFTGMIQLQPKEGWAYLTDVANDPQRNFMLRQAALRAARFFYVSRKDIIPADQAAAAIRVLLNQKDIADVAIEDLRKWSCWDVADQVIDLYGKESHSHPTIQRAIVRYALSCPAAQNPKVVAFVAARTKEDPDLIEEIKEFLRLESIPVGIREITIGLHAGK